MHMHVHAMCMCMCCVVCMDMHTFAALAPYRHVPFILAIFCARLSLLMFFYSRHILLPRFCSSQFGCFGGITIKSGIPSSSKRMSSTATWVLIICITVAVLIAAVAHYRIMYRRISARGGVVPVTMMGILSRLIPVEKFGLKLTPTVTAGASTGISSTNDAAQPSSV